jgi:nucleoside-diphosphate-sugar epimerase
VVRALGGDARVGEIVGIARRMPTWQAPKVRWVSADVSSAPLEPIFAGADAVIHLAWLIQPSRDSSLLERVNVEGSRRVFEAAAAAGVPRLVHASSVGVYSPGPKDRPVDESWPREGVPTLFYARHKAACEHMLDGLEDRIRVVRLRPGLIFKREAGPEIRRLFLGPFVPASLLPFVGRLPLPNRLVTQCVHADDVGEAYRLAALSEHASGAYNIAADPVLRPPRPAPIPPRAVRALASFTYAARLQPAPPGWVDMGLSVPVMDVTRARSELGWEPRVDALSALREVVHGMRAPAGLDTPPLRARAGGVLRVRELLTGLGRRPG